MSSFGPRKGVSSFAPRKNALSRSERRHSGQATLSSFAEPQGVSSFAPRKNALSRSERRHSRQATLSSFAEPQGVSSFAPRKNALSRSERRHSRQATLSSFAEPQGVSSFAPRKNALSRSERRQNGLHRLVDPAASEDARAIVKDHCLARRDGALRCPECHVGLAPRQCRHHARRRRVTIANFDGTAKRTPGRLRQPVDLAGPQTRGQQLLAVPSTTSLADGTMRRT